jgi:hypothetical protein
LNRPGMFLEVRHKTMTIPLARKVDGKKFMWDGVVYDSDDQAQQVMEGYAKDGFEVQKFVNDGQFLVYSRRVATVAKSGD